MCVADVSTDAIPATPLLPVIITCMHRHDKSSALDFSPFCTVTLSKPPFSSPVALHSRPVFTDLIPAPLDNKARHKLRPVGKKDPCLPCVCGSKSSVWSQQGSHLNRVQRQAEKAYPFPLHCSQRPSFPIPAKPRWLDLAFAPILRSRLSL